MYPSSAVQRSPTDEEGRARRDRTGSASYHLPPYPTRSPTMAHYNPYSPPNGPPQQPVYNTGYASTSRPSSSAAMSVPSAFNPNQSPRQGPPQSPTNGVTHTSLASYTPRDQGKSTYYDPTSEHRESQSSWNQSSYANRSPIQVRYCLGIKSCLL